MPVVVPATGSATVTGTLVKPNVTTDDVTFTITQNGSPVFSQLVPAGSTTSAAGTPVNVSLTLNQGDTLIARISSNTRVNLASVSFNPVLTYQTINGATAPTAPDGTPLLTFMMPATAQVFGVSTSATPVAAWSAPGGQVEVTQTVSGSGPATLNAQVTLAVKSGGTLIAEQVVSIVNGAISGTATLDVVLNLAAGTPVTFTAEATDPAVVSNFTIGAPTDAAGDVIPYDVRVDTSVADPFGGGYRNWWFADYTPAVPSAPIDQTLLRFPVGTTDAQHPDPVLQHFAGMLPFQGDNRWQARDAGAFVSNSFNGVSGAFMGSTRAGARIISLTDGTGFGGGQGIIKSGSASNAAVQISLLFFGTGTSNGTSGSDIDFLDFNGDGYPDVVGGGSVQATLPNGALGGQRIALASPSQVRNATVESDNVTLGATTSALRATAGMFGLDTASEQAPYNLGFSGGVGTSASHGTTMAQWDLIDINGDGLPDFVQQNGSGGLTVMLNLGYRFGQAETWNASGLRLERTAAHGFSGDAGFTTPAYSYGGGISSAQSQAATETDLIDVNGDGLPDLVFKAVDSDAISSTGSQIQVALNTGAGFLPAQPWNGALPVPILSRSGAYRNQGLHFSVSTPFVGVVVNPGHNHGDSISGSQSQMRDFDGDGYADHIAASGAAVTVHLNQRGRTNLLQTITRPLGQPSPSTTRAAATPPTCRRTAG
jgi:hypothetical protein